MMRLLFFWIIRRLADLCDRWYGFSPADHWRCEGRADGFRMAEDQLRHFAWGHPEIDMKRAADAMRAHAEDWDPDRSEP